MIVSTNDALARWLLIDWIRRASPPRSAQRAMAAAPAVTAAGGRRRAARSRARSARCRPAGRRGRAGAGPARAGPGARAATALLVVPKSIPMARVEDITRLLCGHSILGIWPVFTICCLARILGEVFGMGGDWRGRPQRVAAADRSQPLAAARPQARRSRSGCPRSAASAIIQARSVQVPGRPAAASAAAHAGSNGPGPGELDVVDANQRAPGGAVPREHDVERRAADRGDHPRPAGRQHPAQPDLGQRQPRVVGVLPARLDRAAAPGQLDQAGRDRVGVGVERRRVVAPVRPVAGGDQPPPPSPRAPASAATSRRADRGRVVARRRDPVQRPAQRRGQPGRAGPRRRRRRRPVTGDDRERRRGHDPRRAAEPVAVQALPVVRRLRRAGLEVAAGPVGVADAARALVAAGAGRVVGQRRHALARSSGRWCRRCTPARCCSRPGAADSGARPLTLPGVSQVSSVVAWACRGRRRS